MSLYYKKTNKSKHSDSIQEIQEMSGLLLYLRSRNLSCSELWMETSSVLETEAFQMTRQQTDE